MLSIGLWRWYINITITILDIIHHPVFLFKTQLSSIGFVRNLKGNTLRLRYEPNRLMLSIGLWRWYIYITITILDIIHRPVFYLTYKVSETSFCLRLQVEDPQLGPTDRASLCLRNVVFLNKIQGFSSLFFFSFTWGWRQIQSRKRRVFSLLKIRTMDKVQKHISLKKTCRGNVQRKALE
jgi:hypothetical protein